MTTRVLLTLGLPLAAAGVVLFVLTLAHGLRMVVDGDQRYAGHVALAAIAGAMLIPAAWAWVS